MRKRFLIIHNANAGPARRHLFSAVLDSLQQRGAAIVLQAADSVEADTQLARDAVASGTYDAVVAAGGDSTIRGVGSGLLGTDLPLGLIPVGTGNVMAAEIGLRRQAGDIAEHLMIGPTRPLYGARANGEPFFLMAGAGFDGTVIAALNTDLKRRIGKSAYAAPILSTMIEPLPHLQVHVDGQEHEARWAIVTNARSYAGSFVLSPGSSVHSPELTIVLFQPRSRTELLAQLVRIASGTLGLSPRVTAVQGRSFVIHSDAPVPVQIDGEQLATTPLIVERDSRQIHLLTPPELPQNSQDEMTLEDAA
ncbi:MAG: diacylglycerol/lipid kinase family protein [Methyloligellaceae bacterium]